MLSYLIGLAANFRSGAISQKQLEKHREKLRYLELSQEIQSFQHVDELVQVSGQVIADLKQKLNISDNQSPLLQLFQQPAFLK